MKTKFGALLVDGTGKLGGHVFQGTRSGSMLRSQSYRKHQMSVSQESQRVNFRRLVTLWRKLTESQRIAWETERTKYQSGFAWFVGINLLRLANGMDISLNPTNITTPPPENNIGKTWELLSNLPAYEFADSLNYNGSTTILALGTDPDNIYRSVNRGASWSNIAPFAGGLTPRSTVHLSGNTWLAVTYDDNILYKSTDNAATWSATSVTFDNDPPAVIGKLDNGYLIVGGSGNGSMYLSIDNGDSFTWIQDNASVTDVLCICDMGSGIVLAGTNTTGKILRSTNAGYTWSEITITGIGSSVRSIVNMGSGVAIAVSSFGRKIFRSTNNGSTWSLVLNISPVGDLFSIAKGADNIAVVGSSVANILKRTKDNGLTWSDTSASYAFLNCHVLLPLDNGNMLASVGNSGNILISYPT